MNITIFLGKTITCILEDFVVKLRAPTTLIKIKLSGIKDFILGKQSVDSSQNRNVIGGGTPKYQIPIYRIRIYRWRFDRIAYIIECLKDRIP